MNYEPNTIHWQPGDLVLHDADAKQRHMLMCVTGYTRDGLVLTTYIESTKRRKVWENELKYLHDPQRFGIKVKNSATEWISRDDLGKLVRQTWVDYCLEIGDTKPSHIVPWDELSEQDKEADRRIGEAVEKAYREFRLLRGN